MNGDVDQTIQWARESLQRRRSELNQKKLESSSVGASSQSSINNAVNVTSILERGRALLKQAEAHSEALGKYTSHASNKHEGIERRDGDDFMARFLQVSDESSNVDDTGGVNGKRFANIPVERPSWKNQFQHDDNEDDVCLAEATVQPSPRKEDDKALEELLQEGEARVRLDNLIATIRRQGDDPLAAEVARSQANSSERISNFDPNEMRAAKRAAIKKLKLDEAMAEAEKEAAAMSKFKALPLPNGAEVKHDLFAPTLAFQRKHDGIEFIRNDTRRVVFHDLSSSQSLGGFEGFDRMSVATSRTSNDGSLNLSYANEEDKERALQLRLAKKAKKKQLLDSVNRTIVEEMGEPFNDDVSIAYSVHTTQNHVDYLEDPSKLRHDIQRLEAKLKRKKSQRSAALNDIVDIDLNSIFERLLSEDANEDARRIVDRLKHKVCGNIVDGVLVDGFQPQLPQLKEHRSWTDEANTTSRGVLYERQENWIRQREQKMVEARLKIEAEEMNGITGKPQLNHTKDSWKKAKDAHDEALKKIAEEETRRQRDKAERERIEYEIKRKEAEDLQKQVNAQMKSVRSDANREEQMKRLEKLSQPRQVRVGSTVTKQEDVSSPVAESPKLQLAYDTRAKHTFKATSDASDTPYELSHAYKTSTKKAPKATSTANEFVEFSGKRFSEMDDKEFAKIVQRISKLAKQKVKDAAASKHNDEATPDSPKFTIIGNPENLCADEPTEKALGGKFCGSAAQAKFLQKISKET
jgi:hypothetical protein